jgi:hypothetical protein
MKRFVARTAREKILLRWMWLLLNELDDTCDGFIPPATSSEERIDQFIMRIRKRFPELHKKYSKKLARQFKEILHQKGFIPKKPAPTPKKQK